MQAQLQDTHKKRTIFYYTWRLRVDLGRTICPTYEAWTWSQGTTFARLEPLVGRESNHTASLLLLVLNLWCIVLSTYVFSRFCFLQHDIDFWKSMLSYKLYELSNLCVDTFSMFYLKSIMSKMTRRSTDTYKGYKPLYHSKTYLINSDKQMGPHFVKLRYL